MVEFKNKENKKYSSIPKMLNDMGYPDMAKKVKDNSPVNNWYWELPWWKRRLHDWFGVPGIPKNLF